MGWYRWLGDDLELTLKVQPRAKRDELVGPADGHYRVRIKAPPVDGKANLALRRFIADMFGVAPSRVALTGGETSRIKRLLIQAPRRLPIPLPRP
jgi:uncharacterized protein